MSHVSCMGNESGRGGEKEHYAFLCKLKGPGVRWGEVCFPVGCCVMGADRIHKVGMF